MSSFLLIRHAETSGQEPEAALTPQGLADAIRLGEVLRALGVTAVVSSPYRRALETVAPFADAAGLSVAQDPRLVEFRLAGAPRPEWREDLRRAFGCPDVALPGGESVLAARSRALAAAKDALAVGGRVAICTHGALAAILLGAFDPRAGFDTWAALRTPDLFDVRSGEFEPVVW